MSLIHIVKTGKHANNADMVADNVGWTGGNSSNAFANAGRFGDRCVSILSSSGHYQLPWAAVTSEDTVIMAGSFQMNLTSVSSGITTIMAAVDAVDQFHWRVAVAPTGCLQILDSSDAVVAITPPLGYGVWHWIEVKALMANSGNVQVRVDGIEVANVNGDFRDGTSDALTAVRFSGPQQGSGTAWDEVIIMDDAGASFNDFIGDTRIEYSLVDADGATVNWTASAGSDFQCVDDGFGAYNDDTDYVSSSTNDQDEYFSHATVVATGVSAVKFAALTALVRDDGSNTFRIHVNSGGTIDRSGSDINPTTAYQWHTYAWLVDPNTTAAWAVSALNAAEWGLRCRT